MSLLAETHADSGLVVETNAKSRSILVSCAEIPGYMAPMEMWFKVRLPAELNTLKPGMQIRFNIVTSGHELYAEQIKQEASENFESEPMQAGGLTAISSALNPGQAATIVKVGEPVPDFTLTDQSGEQVHLSQFRNKVVALTFGYSRCPNPNYCRRLSNNLAGVERRFASHAGRDLILLTIDIDPEHDNGKTLFRLCPGVACRSVQMALPVGIKTGGKAGGSPFRHGLLARRRSSHSLTPHRHHRPQRSAGRES